MPGQVYDVGALELGGLKTSLLVPALLVRVVQGGLRG
jgi:hypothetical protein